MLCFCVTDHNDNLFVSFTGPGRRRVSYSKYQYQLLKVTIMAHMVFQHGNGVGNKKANGCTSINSLGNISTLHHCLAGFAINLLLESGPGLLQTDVRPNYKLHVTAPFTANL